jgi:predicted MFS family arabinose efflux permease
MVRNVGFTQDQIALIFLIGGIATIFSAPFLGRLTDQIGVMKVFITVMIISIIPTIAITHMGEQKVWFALVFTTLFFVFGSGRFIPANTLITAAVGSETRGSFMSLRSALGQLGIALSSFLSGIIIFISTDGSLVNYEYVAYLAIAIGFVAVYMTSKIRVATGN